MPIIELINTGTEILLGSILNTHQQWICRQLADHGYEVRRQLAIPDSGDRIREAVAECLARADLVITTGGLGPTSDDLTRDKIAELLGRPLVEDEKIVRHIEQFFAARRRPMPQRTRVQAQVPQGALVLENPHGTAPGLALEVPDGRFRSAPLNSWLVMLPGPPRELHPMFRDTVLPFLKERFPLEEPYVCRVLRSTGLGESLVEQQIEQPLQALIEQGLTLGFCARTGEVDIRIAARQRDAQELVAKAEAVIRREIGRHIFGAGEATLEEAVISRLTERQETVALAESCTGGYITHRLTNVPGASAAVLGGWVTYSNEAKMKCLGVQSATLARHGAVSEAAAREMAEGARAQSGADYAIAVTGIAGPAGGSPEKPVGTVFIALASAQPTLVLRQINAFDRETFKHVTSRQALEMLRRRLLSSTEP